MASRKAKRDKLFDAVMNGALSPGRTQFPADESNFGAGAFFSTSIN